VLEISCHLVFGVWGGSPISHYLTISISGIGLVSSVPKVADLLSISLHTLTPSSLLTSPHHSLLRTRGIGPMRTVMCSGMYWYWYYLVLPIPSCYLLLLVCAATRIPLYTPLLGFRVYSCASLGKSMLLMLFHLSISILGSHIL